MKQRSRNKLVLIILLLSALVLALGFGILPELDEMAARPVPGEIVFRTATLMSPAPSHTLPVSTGHRLRKPFEWVEEHGENLWHSKFNPWRGPRASFGGHYAALSASSDPHDQAKCRELARLSEAWYHRLLVRHPEMAVPVKHLPADQNGFLQWLEFSESFGRVSSPLTYHGFVFSPELDNYLNGTATWNAAAARSWLAAHSSLMERIRNIGLLPEASNHRIAIDRWWFTPGKLAKNCNEALLIEARLAASDGNTNAALESVRAAKGLADHFVNVESPTLLGATIQILSNLTIANRVFCEIIPALPAGSFDVDAWENAVQPTVSQPDEFARLLKGEWSASVRQCILPVLLDGHDPESPPDSGALLDAHCKPFLEIIIACKHASLTHFGAISIPDDQDLSHLSRRSREPLTGLHLGTASWRKGWERAQHVNAMNQAAFAILKGQSVPNDPVHGLPYVGPATRQLSAPASPLFQEMAIKPIVVPAP